MHGYPDFALANSRAVLALGAITDRPNVDLLSVCLAKATMASHDVLAPRIIQLARTIRTDVVKIDAALAANDLPSPSIAEDVPLGYLSSDILDAQDAVLDATAELHDLLLEPLHLTQKHSWVSERFARPDDAGS
jgi:hypothetical protein